MHAQMRIGNWMTAAMMCLLLMVPIGRPEMAVAQEAEPPALDEMAKQVQATYEQNVEKYRDQKRILVRRGLVADAQTRRVTITAAARALSPEAPVEFVLIHHDNIAKDHETLAFSFARASDIRAAMEHIGMQPGRPVNFRELHLWPKGERVVMMFHWDEPAERGRGSAKRSVRVEQLLTRSQDGKRTPFENTGLVYTGSYWITNENTNKRDLAADVSDSTSIVSAYNEPVTLFDFPAQAPQGEVYETIHSNPAYRFERHQWIRVTIEPEPRPKGDARVRDVALSVISRTDRPAHSARDLRFDLRDKEGRSLTAQGTLPQLLAHLESMAEARRDPFVTLSFGEHVGLKAAAAVAQVMDGLQSAGRVRMEPPPDGQLFYRAFMPDPEWRDRKERLIEPWELHLTVKGGKVKAELIDVREEWLGGGKSRIVQTRHDVPNGAAMAKFIRKADGKRPRSIFTFAPPQMTYGRLMAWLNPCMNTHGEVYVFLQAEE